MNNIHENINTQLIDLLFYNLRCLQHVREYKKVGVDYVDPDYVLQGVLKIIGVYGDYSWIIMSQYYQQIFNTVYSEKHLLKQEKFIKKEIEEFLNWIIENWKVLENNILQNIYLEHKGLKGHVKEGYVKEFYTVFEHVKNKVTHDDFLDWLNTLSLEERKKQFSNGGFEKAKFALRFQRWYLEKNGEGDLKFLDEDINH